MMTKPAIWILGLLVLGGCGETGPRRASVTGAVQLDGQDIEEGSILFIPTDGTKGAEGGGAIRQGKYAIASNPGVAIGKNRVELRASRKTGKKIQDPTAKPGTLVDEVGEAFPKEANDASTLVREVKEGANTHDFRITTK